MTSGTLALNDCRRRGNATSRDANFNERAACSAEAVRLTQCCSHRCAMQSQATGSEIELMSTACV